MIDRAVVTVSGRIGAGLVLASLLLAAPIRVEAATVVYVDSTATGLDDGSSWQDAFTDLQSALALPPGPMELWVAAGEYRPAAVGNRTATFHLKDDVALFGGFSGVETERAQRDPVAHETVLSGDLAGNDTYGGYIWWQGSNGYGENSYQVVTASGVGATAVLDGFTIRNGYAVSSIWSTSGGAGLFSLDGSPTVRGCTFTRSIAAWRGAGAYCSGGTPTFEACTFVENLASSGGKGGGLCVASGCFPVVADCLFQDNTVLGTAYAWGAGGAVFVDSGAAVTFERCDFLENIARNAYPVGGQSAASGGAVCTWLTAGSAFHECTFVGNHAEAGGAIRSSNAITVRNCLFNGNEVESHDLGAVGKAGGFGGAIASYGSVSNPPTVTITGSTIVHNGASDEGGGIYLYGGAIGDVNDCVLLGNTDSRGNIGAAQSDGADPVWSCVENLLVGEPGEDPPDPADFPGSIDLDPLFVDRLGADGVAGTLDDDLRLMSGSPCIDAGNNTLFPVGSLVDLDGNTRKHDDPATVDTGVGPAPIVDMGAYEFGAVPADWQDLGNGLAGINGVPALEGQGPLVPGGAVTLGVSSAAPLAPAFLFVGLSRIDAPFKGGVLVPALDQILLGFATDPLGELQLPGSVPNDLPSGVSVFIQAWIQDGAAVAGYAATNAITATSP